MRFEGRVAIVTGGTAGIGLACAQASARRRVHAPRARRERDARPISPALRPALPPCNLPHQLPRDTVHAEYALEYGTDALERHADAIPPSARVLIHDDLLATGGTAEAKADLVQQLGANVVGLAFLIELSFLRGRERFEDLPLTSLIVVGG